MEALPDELDGNEGMEEWPGVGGKISRQNSEGIGEAGGRMGGAELSEREGAGDGDGGTEYETEDGRAKGVHCERRNVRSTPMRGSTVGICL